MMHRKFLFVSSIFLVLLAFTSTRSLVDASATKLGFNDDQNLEKIDPLDENDDEDDQHKSHVLLNAELKDEKLSNEKDESAGSHVLINNELKDEKKEEKENEKNVDDGNVDGDENEDEEEDEDEDNDEDDEEDDEEEEEEEESEVVKIEPGNTENKPIINSDDENQSVETNHVQKEEANKPSNIIKEDANVHKQDDDENKETIPLFNSSGKKFNSLYIIIPLVGLASIILVVAVIVVVKNTSLFKKKPQQPTIRSSKTIYHPVTQQA